MDDEKWRLFPVVRADTSGLLIVDTELLDLAPLAELPIAVLASLTLEFEQTKAQTDRLEEGLQSHIEQAGGPPCRPSSINGRVALHRVPPDAAR